MKLCTQNDLAKAVGVSQRAVASVVGTAAGDVNIRVSPRTRQRILSAAKRLGYHPHRQAQILRGGKSGIIGILQFGGITPFAAERGIAVAQAVRKAEFDVLACDVQWYEGAAAACTRLLDARVEGVLLSWPPRSGSRSRNRGGCSAMAFPSWP